MVKAVPEVIRYGTENVAPQKEEGRSWSKSLNCFVM